MNDQPGPLPREHESTSSLENTWVVDPAQSATDVAARLPGDVQRRNVIYYVAITALFFLCAPVLNVGIVQTTLCDRLGASKAVANLPTSASMFTAFVTPIVAWLVPQTRWVVPMAAGGYGVAAVISAVMAILLVAVESQAVLIVATIAYGGICGVSLFTASVYLWEVLARGVSEAKRGVTFSLCFGFGPILAIAGSAGTHFVLQERIPWLTYPRDYACIFAATAPCMAIAALLATRFCLSQTQEVHTREAFTQYLIGGTWDFLRQRRFLIVTVSYLLTLSAWSVVNNATLYVRDVLGVDPKETAGLANAVRFAGKVLCGFILGWTYSRFPGRMATIGTAVLTTLAIAWALAVPGRAYLGTFALFGGGELAGIYYFTYVVSASSPKFVKRNTAILGMVGALLGMAPFGLGAVADSFGIPASLWVAFVVAVLGAALLFAVPVHPERLAISSGQGRS